MKLADLKDKHSVPEFLQGGGELGQRIREYDWASTPLGPVQSWPQSLRTCIRIMLTSRQPIWIGWGKQLIKLYNDPYKAIVGGKHPWALGTPASIVWKDIWRDIEPMLKQVMEKDEGTYVESQLLIMERNGYPEETYYTFSYTPIPGDEGTTAGMICANTDDTDRIISERQLRTLTHLGKALTDSRSNADVIDETIDTLKENPHDFPFALFYSIENNKAVLSNATDLGDADDAVPRSIDLDANNEISFLLQQAITERKMQVFEQLTSKLGAMPRGAWEVAPDKAIILPVVQAGAKEPYGFLVVGLNPYRLLDEKYRGFFSLVADQVATSFTSVHALEEERKRLEALAEIDRAKTTFFSNISHEFRTPLTLLLGPIEDMLNDANISAEERTRLELPYRNALRMQKLVNTLLEFSRIEAGRVEGSFSKVDICAFTQDLASTFRSAIEKAGMQLEFECAQFSQEVYVDTEMWEKIVLNLVSNAFKYTKQGSIKVRVSVADDQVQLSVSDTGIGIPEDQLGKIFDRFHRVENTGGRSQEGTGIGLAMVRELVRIHHGSITVASMPGKGTRFTVSIPSGKDHLPADKITGSTLAATSANSVAFVQEAMKWMPGANPGDDGIANTNAAQPATRVKYKVLLADDNADMREYVQRLLAYQFHVITAIDGEEAFEKCLQYKPDLLLSDVMMPRLDGFGLLKKVRGHHETKNIPVIFLSARAGEEAKVEGLSAGADDYLVKPFSAKELVARVESNIKIARSRIAAENNLRNIITQSPVSMAVMRGPRLVLEMVNERSLEIWGRRYEEVIDRPIDQALPEIVEQGLLALLQQVYATGVPFTASERPVTLLRNGRPEQVYVNFIFEPLKDSDNVIEGIVAVGFDVTAQVIARRKIEENEAFLEEEVRRRTQQLNELNISLQQSNNDLQQFAHVASHDLKEPLRKVKVFSGRLADDPGTKFSDKSRIYIEKINSAVDRMFMMVEGVLHYSMMNANSQTVECVDLNTVFQNIESDLELPISQKSAKLEYSKLPSVEGAMVLIYQLFYNLVNNSLKFSKDGVDPYIKVSSSIVQKNGKDYAQINVEDNGIGFEQDQAQRIFNTFERLNSKDRYEGTGLGLSLCKRIAQRHGGSIEAHGREEQGAIFIVELPVKQPKNTI
jgi:signal transduction histidine kinase